MSPTMNTNKSLKLILKETIRKEKLRTQIQGKMEDKFVRVTLNNLFSYHFLALKCATSTTDSLTYHHHHPQVECQILPHPFSDQQTKL